MSCSESWLGRVADLYVLPAMLIVAFASAIGLLTILIWKAFR